MMGPIRNLIGKIKYKAKEKKKKVEHRDKAKAVEKTEKYKEGSVITVKIIKKIGKSIEVETTTGRIKKSGTENDKMSIYELDVEGYDKISYFDFTKINRNGEVWLLLKPDGSLVYADVDEDELTGYGEGLLRDGYHLNQEWIERNFTPEETKWSRFIPIIISLIGIASLLIAFYLGGKYIRTSISAIEKTQDKYLELQRQQLETQKLMAQNIEKLAEVLHYTFKNQNVTVVSK